MYSNIPVETWLYMVRLRPLVLVAYRKGLGFEATGAAEFLVYIFYF